jgi:hypothetical protein
MSSVDVRDSDVTFAGVSQSDIEVSSMNGVSEEL